MNTLEYHRDLVIEGNRVFWTKKGRFTGGYTFALTHTQLGRVVVVCMVGKKFNKEHYHNLARVAVSNTVKHQLKEQALQEAKKHSDFCKCDECIAKNIALAVKTWED